MSRFKKIFCSTLLIIAMFANTSIFAAEGANESNITEDAIAYENYNNCLDEISIINLDIDELESKNANHQYDEEIDQLKKQKDNLLNEIKLYGGNTFDDQIMQDIFLNADYSGSPQSRSLTNNELQNLLNQLKNDYTATGTQTSYSTGGETFKVYEITVQNSGSTLSSSHLTNNKTQVLYQSAFSANSTTAHNFINEIISIYISKGISTILNVVPGVSYLPYELAFPSNKPSNNEISSSGNTLTCTLAVGSVVRFSYVLNTTNNSWVYCLSSNKITPTLKMDFCLYRGSVPYFPDPVIKREVIDGGINSSLQTAVSIFKSMLTNSYVSPANVGINSVSYKTLYDNSISANTCAPSTPLGLM